MKKSVRKVYFRVAAFVSTLAALFLASGAGVSWR